MKIESPEFGTIEIAEDKVIEFPLGLPGFEDSKRFAFVHAKGSDGPVFMLQSADDPAVAFSVTTPDNFGIHYHFDLDDDEVALIQHPKPEDVLVAVIVRKADEEGSPDSAGLRANFMAPLVINVGARRGLQKVIGKLGCDITLRAQA